jgi:hypothetical protein
MSTTLIVQTSDLLAPNIRIYDAHVVDLYQYRSVRVISLV